VSRPAQGARRTRGQLLIAWLVVALPASLAAAATGEAGASPVCAGPAAPSAPAASPALPFPALPAPPVSRLRRAPGATAAATATGALVPDEPPQANAERGFAVATALEPTFGVPLAAIGARFDGPSRGGAVYLFAWTGRRWEEMLHCASTQPGEQFGISVALHDDILAVGAPGEEQDRQRPEGAVFLIHLVFAEQELARRTAPRIARTERIASLPAGVASLGRTIVLDDSRLAVSATIPGADGVLGAVLVYPLPYVPGSAAAVLMPAVPQLGDRFGESLALSNGTLFAGAPGRRGLADQAAAGAVYVLPLASGGPPAGELRPPQEAADAQFGASVSASGPSLAVGAAGAVGAGGSGAVYVFTLADGTWTPRAALAPDPAHAAVGEQFGHTVAIDGDLLVAGAPLSSAGAAYGGAAFLFQRQGDAWDTVPDATVAGAEPHALLGSAVALLDGVILVGAPLSNQGAGAVYPYDFAAAAGAASPRPPP
jgi:FG-GAP repeat